MKSIQDFFSGLCSLVYPNNCLYCKNALGNDEAIICDGCRGGVVFNIPPFCPTCSRHMSQHPESGLCRQCQKHNFAFDHVWGVCAYNDFMRKLIHLFKYQNKTCLRLFFRDLIISFITQYHISFSECDWIVAVPLHSSKLREREYNQSQLLANELSRTLKIPLLTQSLIRIRATKTQAFLNEKERWTNVQGAFRIKQTQTIKKKSFLIIDDLMTTGATVCETAVVLKNAGAKKVEALTLAIA